MSRPLPADVERFRAVVTRHFGIQLDDSRLAGLRDLLEARAREGRTTIDALLERLEARDAQELRALASRLTVPETFFFRDRGHFRALKEAVLPARTSGRTRRLRLLSAGCASGEEPFSIAMALMEAPLPPGWSAEIHAFDVSPAALSRAARGRFSPWSLRDTPPEVRSRWFRADGDDLVLDDAVRRLVRFEERNLNGPEPWAGAGYDVIFWRNVMMYFTPEVQRAALARITRALLPGGYLFLGHAESLRGMSDELELEHTHEAFYYRRASGARSVPPSPPPPPASQLPETADASWVDAIENAARRIRTLVDAPGDGVREPDPSHALDLVEARADGTTRAAAIAEAFELLERERFTDAIAVLDALRPPLSGDRGALLLRAALLTHAGLLDRAEQACRDLLATDERDAGAHYLLGLCRDAGGDQGGAADHHERAAHLDPDFAMPRLHLGLIRRRANDLELARRDLVRALVLLEREEPSRLLLFGGGFRREALVAMCRGQIAACGGVP